MTNNPMRAYNLVIVTLVIVAAIGLIVFLNWKNSKDRRSVNPDKADIVEEEHHDQQRRSDKS